MAELSPTSEVTPEPTAADPTIDLPAEVTDEATQEGSSDPETPVATAVAASLTYAPDFAPTCVALDRSATQALPAGGALDYRCVYAIAISSEQVSIDEVANWISISAVVPAGLTLRFRTDQFNELAWGEPFRDEAVLNDEDFVASAVELVPNEGILATFFVRLERDQCSIVVGDVVLGAAAEVWTPNRDDVAISRFEPDPEPFYLSPELMALPINAPAVQVTDFTLAPIQFALEDQVASGSLTIEMVNPDRLCSDAVLELGLNQNSPQAAVLLEIWSADGAFVANPVEPGTQLNQSVVLGILPAGTEAGTFTLTVSFDLTVPGGLMAGTFNVIASALVHIPSD